MKKLIFSIALFIGFSLPSNAQSQLYDSVRNDIKELVKELQGPAKDVYNIHKMQVILEAWTGIIVSSAVFIVFLVINLLLCKQYLKDDEWAIPLGIMSFLSIISLIVAICLIANGFIILQNPDYQAIKLLMNNIRG